MTSQGAGGRVRTLHRSRVAALLLATLALTACSSLGVLGDLGDRVVVQPLAQVARAVGLYGADDFCARSASLVNPATPVPGLGGTGAPAVVAAVPGGIGGTGQPAQRPGLGGTGQVAAAPGLGGTGQVAAPGLGGTGQVAGHGVGGTGIVGVVTGFGSICVNGLRVEYMPDTPVLRDGQPAPQSALAVGQVVALQADGDGARLRAGRIAVLDTAVGPLSVVDAASGRFELMGQSGTALERADLAGLLPGQWVRVSGHRLASGEIRASRVQASEPGLAWVSGPAQPEAGGWRVGTTPVVPENTAWPADLAPGQELGVLGRWTGDRLVASQFVSRPTRTALGAVDDVVLQGYVHGVQGRELRLGFDTLTLGQVLQVLGGSLDALRAGQPVLVRGRVDGQQRLVVDRLEFRHEGRRGERGSVTTGSDDSDDRDDSDNSGSGSGSGNGGDSGGQGRGRGRGRGGD